MPPIYMPKNKAATEHRGSIDRVVFSDPDQPFVILLLTDDATVCGPATADQFAKGTIYRFLGKWEDNDKRGPRFRFSTFVVHAAHGRAGVVKYLTDACDGIGAKTAERIYAKFRGDAVETLRTDPAKVAAECNLEIGICELAAIQLASNAKYEDTRIDLFTLFAGRGFQGKLIEAAINKWGVRAPTVIRRNPFAMLPLPSAGFKRCDKLWTDLSLPKDSLKRTAIVAAHLVKSDTNGNTWVSASDLAAKLREMIPGADVMKALKLGLRARKLKKYRDGSGGLWLATYHRATSEERIAAAITRLSAAPCLWPTDRVPVSQVDGDRLPSAHQIDRLTRATASPVGMLLGGPGTGKTHVTGYLLREVIREFGQSSITVCAPTGKAAVRATQALSLAGLDLTARTIHSTLEIGRNGHDGDGWGFVRGPGNPLECRFLVCDETSMNDTDLMADLLDAAATGTHVLLIGDPHQLPPVGHGAPLRDMIAGKVSHGELTEVRRNAGQIVHACVRIKNGESFETTDKVDLEPGDGAPPRNLKLVSAKDETHAREQLLATLKDMTLFNPTWQTQVIVARNTKGEISRKKLNELLHPLLNPDGYSVAGNPFKVGDKIICTRNSRMHRVEPFSEFHESYAADMAREAANYEVVRDDNNQPEEVYVANGEIGRVVAIAAKLAVARFSEGDSLVKIPMGKQKDDDGDGEGGEDEGGGRGCNFDHAYAITCHKCVHPDTLVETAEGLLPIRSVLDSGTVATPTGPQSYPVRFANSAGPALKIDTKHGYEITVTPDHGVERWNGSAYERCEAGELKTGDWLRLKLGATIGPQGGATLPSPPKHDVRAAIYRLPERVTAEVAEFFGLMVADGTVWSSGFRLVKRHLDVAERFGELCRTIFGCDPVPVTNGNATGYEVRSTYLASWILAVGGMSPHAKAVPEAILRSPIAMHRRFLRGLFEDGTVNLKDDACDHIEWMTAYPELARVVHTMLLRCGVFATRTKKTAGNTRGFVYDVLYLYGQSALVFRDTIGFISEFKQSRLETCRSGNVRYTLPVDRSRSKELRNSLGKSAGDNLLARGYVSRDTAAKLGWAGELSWFHTTVTEITPTECPSMCFEVPVGHRFLQNGFPFWNCQGSEAPCVIVMGDEQAGQLTTREWIYTAISRASKLCILIGKMSTFNKMKDKRILSRRKTFLRELILEQRYAEL